MNARNQLLVKGGLSIVILWVGVVAVSKLAGSFKPSPAKIVKFAKNNPLDELEDPEERKQVIGRIAEMMNQLDPEDLQKFEGERSREESREMFMSMTPEEQWFFMEKRMGRAFSQMMEVFNGMERSERKKMVERALSQMKKNEQDGGPMEEATPEMVEKIATAGMKAYFKDASAETKLDLAPLMEELQKTMSSPGGRHRRR